MCSVLKREFQRENLGYNFYREDVFYTAQWRWHPAVFVVFRIIVAGFLLVTLTRSIVTDFSRKYFIYLTNQSLTMETTAHVVAAIVAVIGYVKRRRGQTLVSAAEMTNVGSDQALETPDAEPEEETAGEELQKRRLAWYLKLSWVLSSMTDILALVVSFSYWGILYPVKKDAKLDYKNFEKHALNSVAVLLDAAISARPTRLLHTVYMTVYGIAYMVLTLIYWGIDKENNIIYVVLDWNKPLFAVSVVIGVFFGLVPLASLLRFGIYRLRLRVFEKIYGETY